MLSYMLPREDKPPVGEREQVFRSCPSDLRHSGAMSAANGTAGRRGGPAEAQHRVPRTRSSNGGIFAATRADEERRALAPRPGSAAPILPVQHQPTLVHQEVSPKHNGTVRKSTLHHAPKVAKDDSLYSIDSDASTAGSDRRAKIIIATGPKNPTLKRVSFGSSKGSMVETLVFETPVQEEPEPNHFLEQNGRLPPPLVAVPDTAEGREKVRVSLLGPTPFPSTPGVLLLDPIGPPADIMAASAAELLTAHTDHTIPTYHAQISTDSGWDNPFRPDGDLSREADEIVELIKGGKPITPTPGQNAPALPGYETKSSAHETSASPLLDSTGLGTSPRLGQGNGNAHSTPIKPSNNQQSANEKGAATVEVGRVTAQGPGDASQVEHVTLKKKPKCKCCVLQ